MEHKKLLDSLPQLDRIEYRQKENEQEHMMTRGFIIISVGIFVALLGNMFSFVFYVLGILSLVIMLRQQSKLRREYFKVVKK